MLVVTTPQMEGNKIIKYHGLVSGEAIMGANIVKDFLAHATDIVGDRASVYEGELRQAKDTVVQEMSEAAEALGGNAVVGVDRDYESIQTGRGGDNMLMVSASGTAVLYESE